LDGFAFRSAHYVKQILTTKTLFELTRLKLEMDSKGDYHSLHKLVFQDVQDVHERGLILTHIDREAKVEHTERTLALTPLTPLHAQTFLSNMKLGTKAGQKLMASRPWRKVGAFLVEHD
jgi:hypothetical protein